MKKMKFVIYSPRQKHGGAIVLHAICKNLVNEGYDARVYYPSLAYFPRYDKDHFSLKSVLLYCYYLFLYVIDTIKFVFTDTYKVLVSKILPKVAAKSEKYFGYYNPSVKGCKRKFLPFVNRNTVVLYPEATYGNPLHASKVTRIFLYHYPHADNEKARGKDDLFFAYREVFNDWKLNPQCRKLHVSYFDLDLYKKCNYGERKGMCYILRKGVNRDDVPKNLEGIVVDSLTEKEKVRVFNECEYCICYDTQTAYSSIASICGCKTIIVPEEGKTKNDYYGSDDLPIGVAWSFEPEEIEKALSETEALLQHFRDVNEKGKEHVRQYILTCREYFSL